MVQNIKRSKIYLLVTAVLAFASFGVVPTASAASTLIYISPASKSVKTGTTFSVGVYIEPDQRADTAHVVMSYDASKLQYISHDTAGSPLNMELGDGTSSGHVQFDSAKLGGYVTGTTFVANVTFKALASSGSSTIGMAGSDVAYAGGSLHASNSGSTISFTSTTSTPPPSSGGSGGKSGGSSGSTSSGSSSGSKSSSNSTNPSKSPATSTKPTTKQPAKVVGTTVANSTMQFTQAALQLTSSQPTRVYVSYSSDKTHFQNTKYTGLSTSHSVTLDGLTPGQTYYYYVFSKDQNGHVTKSSEYNFSTKGVSIAVTVYDKNHHVIAGQTVTLHSQAYSQKTNNRGVATFTNVTPGQHELSYTVNGKTYTQPLAVKNNIATKNGQQTAPLQTASITFPIVQTSHNSMIVWAIVIAVLLIIIIFVIVASRRRHGVFGDAQASAAAGAVVGGSSPQPPTSAADTSGAQDLSDRLGKVQGPEQSSPGSTVTPGDGDEADDHQ